MLAERDSIPFVRINLLIDWYDPITKRRYVKDVSCDRASNIGGVRTVAQHTRHCVLAEEAQSQWKYWVTRTPIYELYWIQFPIIIYHLNVFPYYLNELCDFFSFRANTQIPQ